METELETLLESPRAYEEGKKDFVAVNVDEDDSNTADEDDSIFADEDDSTTADEDNSTTADEDDSTTAAVVDSINKNMSLYISRDLSPICIYQVPAKLRRLNEEAFTPRLISIGPIHHGRPELKAMQRYKWRFFSKYLKMMMMPISLDQLARDARDMENQVRQCYQESFDNLDSKEFSEMIMLDAIFLIILLLLGIVKGPVPPYGQLLPKPSESSQVTRNEWVKSDIVHDLMLLENQLPFFVLVHFCNYIGNSRSDLMKRIPRFFSRVGNMGTFEEKEMNESHLVAIIRTYYKPKLYRFSWSGKIVYNRSATELQEAGVIFKGVPHEDIFQIDFSNGCLEIPLLIIDEHTEILFRNLIAFEQCQDGIIKDITSYIIFMDSLINTAKDVDLLVECGVIKNSYGDHERVASLFNNLHKEMEGHEYKFYFEELCTLLNDYSKDYWHQWKAKWFRSKKVLRRDYFNSPWSTISVIAAVILLVLTVVQTVCSIVSILLDFLDKKGDFEIAFLEKTMLEYRVQFQELSSRRNRLLAEKAILSGQKGGVDAGASTSQEFHWENLGQQASGSQQAGLPD